MLESRTFSYARIGLLALSWMGPASPWPGLNAQIPVPAASVGNNAAGVDAVWRKAGADDGLRQAFERATYSLKDSGQGTWHGVSAAQRLTLEFNGSGVRLSHPGGIVNFHLTGYGYGGRLREPTNAVPTTKGNRVEYQRDDLVEWYVNGPQGLEQGFTLSRRPGTCREGEPLVIALGLSGELRPTQKTDDGSVLFASAKGVVLRYAGLKALDGRGRILPSRLEVQGYEIRLIVEDKDAQYPLVVDPTWTQQQKLTTADGVANDLFGASVSVSGDTAVIGAWGKTGYQGAAYVFVRSGGVWSQQQEMTASDGAAGDHFGVSVSVSGDTAMIGALAKTGSQGAAYVFVRSGGVWTQQQKLTASDGAAHDQFGVSVSVSGGTALIGANGNNGGAVYAFLQTGGVWTQQQKLTASDAALGAGFGWSVAVSGDTAVIGTPTFSQGSAYVFARSGGVWTQQQKLTASDGAPFEYFGFSVSVSGDTVVIGSPPVMFQGSAYVFARSGGVWTQQQKLTGSGSVGGVDEGFGSSVAVSGDTALIGAHDSGSAFQGAAYVFVHTGGVWTQQQKLNGAAGDGLGSSVSLTGDTAVIGAPGGNSSQGAVYVFVGAEFADVPPNATYFDAANLMFQAGVTTGCVQTTDPSTRLFCPNDNVTRQEMAAFIVRAVTGTTTPSIYNPVPYFFDVPTTNSFFPHIQKLEELAITTGCAPGLFCPTDTIPRWEMAIFMVRARLALHGATFTTATIPYFADVPTNVEGDGEPFLFIQRSYEEHITNGCGANPLIYCPDELVTRGQMASFIMRGLFNETTVLGPTDPLLTSVTPNTMDATPGTQITVTITGANTNFQTGDTVTVPSGMLAVSEVVVNSATSISAMLAVNAYAVAGPQALVVTSGGQNLTLPLAIQVGSY